MARNLDQVIYSSIVHFVIESVPATKVVWDAERKKPAEVCTPFVPSREEILQDSYARITPEVYKTLVKIWNDSDPDRGGARGVSKYCAAIVHSARLNFLRGQFQRKDEINAQSLSAVDSGVEFADTISDLAEPHNGLSDLLQNALPEKDYEVLRRCVIEGLSIRRYAELTGESKSVVDRRLQRAKRVAKLFVPQLQPDRTSLRTSIAITNSRSLAPDRISPENLAGFAETLRDRIAPFRDPELEYLERHTLMLRARNKRAA